MDAARDAWARDIAAACCACARADAAAESARVLISGVSARGRDQTRAAKHTRRRLVVGVLERDGRQNLGRASPRRDTRERKCGERRQAVDLRKCSRPIESLEANRPALDAPTTSKKFEGAAPLGRTCIPHRATTRVYASTRGARESVRRRERV